MLINSKSNTDKEARFNDPIDSLGEFETSHCKDSRVAYGNEVSRNTQLLNYLKNGNNQ